MMDIFIDNKYTKWYFNIISNARSRVSDSYTEKHHVVPMCFYVRNRSNKPGWIDADPNQADNIVKLTPREHFICHWLLTKMVDNKLAQIKMECALSAFRRSSKTNGLILSSLEYQRIKTAHITALKGRKRGPSPLKGRKQAGPSKHWWNNGEIEIKSEKAPNQTWLNGRLPSPLKGKSNQASKDLSWHNNGIMEKRLITCPEGWQSGRLKHRHGKSGRRGKTYGPHSDITKQKISISNKGKKRSIETRAKMSSDRKGRQTIVKGTRYWTNGEIEVRRVECPGEGWILGRKKNKVDR